MTSVPIQKAPTSARSQRPRLLLAILVGIPLLVLFGYRLTLGADLTDESYYANLVIGRLRVPVGDTGDNSAQVTFSLLLEPFVRAYALFVPDFTGVMLYLRLLYGVMALVTAAAAWFLLRGLLSPVAAGIAACLPVAFIPFGLPAPSYNTVAMMATLSALCLFTGHLLRSWSGAARQGWFGGLAVPAAAGLFAVAVIAYPPIVLVAVAFFLLGVLLTPRWRDAWPLVPLAVYGTVFLLIGVGLVVGLVGLPKFQEILAYDRESGQHLSSGNAVGLGWSQFTSQTIYPVYCALGLLVALVGRIFRNRWFWAIQAMALFGLLVAVNRMPVACFFAPGHDLIFFLAVCGFPLLLDLRLGNELPAEDRIVVLLYCAGMVGGLVTTWTASNALFNFPVGGTLAALAALVGLTRGAPAPTLGRELPERAPVPLAVVAILAVSSFQMIYDVSPTRFDTFRNIIPSGLFAGLRTTSEQAALIGELEKQLAPFSGACRRVLVLSRFTGLYLLTNLKPRTPHSYFWVENPALWHRLHAMTGEPTGLPDLVVAYPATASAVPDQETFLAAHYRLVATDGPALLYLRRGLQEPPTAAPRLPYVVRFDQSPKGTGWSVPERLPDGQWATWMAAREATLLLPRPVCTGTIRLRIDVPSGITLDVLDSLRLTVNGQSIPLMMVPSPARLYEAILTPEILNTFSSQMELRFSVARTIRPSGGGRDLGVLFRRLEFTAADPPTDTSVSRGIELSEPE